MMLRAAIAVFLALLCAGWTPLRPWPIEDIYTSRTIVTGKDERNRPLGFKLCFEDVLVKVSGDITILDNRRVPKLAAKAAQYINSFSYRDRLEGKPLGDEQGTYDRPHYLTCVFDRQKIDAIVTGLKRKIWRGKRPRLMMLISVHGLKKSGMLTSDAPPDPGMVEALTDSAVRYGLTVELPKSKALQQRDINLDNAGATNRETLRALAQASNAELPVLGDLTFSEAATGWIATWKLDADGRQFRWSVRGVNYDAAFRNGVLGVMRALSGDGKP